LGLGREGRGGKEEKEDVRRGNIRKEMCESTEGGDEWNMV
jgi:hypothetical protein